MRVLTRFVATVVLGAGAAPFADDVSDAFGASVDTCCKCRIQPAEAFSSSTLPCQFDVPASWETIVGDDGASVTAVSGARCETACPVSSGLAFSVAKKPNTNAETMEGIWRQVMKVVGKARCGGQDVTFFSLPGADPAGLMGGLRFHVGHGGKRYGANATFTCPEPGEWLRLQQLFIDTFTTNPSTTFGGR
jgi:hypothetical protein